MDTGTLSTVFGLGLLLVDLGIRIALSARVVMRRLPPAVSLAWLVLILLLPLIGAVVYLMVGENRLGNSRIERADRNRPGYQKRIAELRKRHGVEDQARADECVSPSCSHPACGSLARMALSLCGVPPLPGNRVRVYETAAEGFDGLVEGIDEAEKSVHAFFFAWWPGGHVNRVIDALIRARERGCEVRLVADQLGSAEFWRSENHRRLAAAGIRVVPGLPVGVVRALFRRIDIRNHRKLLVIDGVTAFTGSQNLADPELFHHIDGCGRWVDLLLRVEGPAVEPLALVFLQDWELETGQTFDELSGHNGLEAIMPRRSEGCCDGSPGGCADGADGGVCGEQSGGPAGAFTGDGDLHIQVVPSGPGELEGVFYELVVAALYTAEERVSITTPYFVPDSAMLTAVKAAARRGVRVTLMVPHKNDSKLVHFACRSHFQALLEYGVEILLYQDNLLHTKSMIIDESIAIVGTANMDIRSAFLNYELTLAIYDDAFAAKLGDVHERYAGQCQRVTAEAWAKRRWPLVVLDNLAELFTPVL